VSPWHDTGSLSLPRSQRFAGWPARSRSRIKRPTRRTRQSISALRESLPNPTVVVLEHQEHNAMDGGREVLANAIINFAAAKE